MVKTLKTYFKNLGQSSLYWIVVMGLWVIFRYYGLENEIGFEIVVEQENLVFNGLVASVFVGFLIGVLYANIDLLLSNYISKRLSIGFMLFIKTFSYLAITIIVFTLAMRLFAGIYELDVDTGIGWWRQDKSFWAIIIYMAVATLIFSFIKIVSDKFGKGILINMLLGKYKNPQEEKRIFMFLDLKDSTTIAEQLGHFKYSQMIQDCFYDLNEVVPNYDAEIYQYVGDEAVLSWPYKKGLVNNNCIDLFFAFQQKKQAKSKYYLEKYGVIPEFKAGLHGGKLMVAEVGVVKKELAYHGDVINTSARIQGECNTYNVPILISEKLLLELSLKERFKSSFLGSVLLKGKQEEVNIHTIKAL